ncbi:metal ABC transporter permease [Patescibacteria group bacterium]|nr:metal ABC transporter permease [Patescibacteria group bacterium]MBU1722141.1 metal ABC transporter permease [Patescibacteria group bacterium]MBU1901190.1 metal ABC transporter permease [Patescibacteria group bacterium]
MLEFLSYPFMIRALIAGGVVAVLLGWLGVFVVTRKMSFIGDGIAHASLAGIALAVLVGWAPIPVAVVFAVIIALGIYMLEQKTNMSSDMAIAMMFTTGMAIGILLLNAYEGYQPELISYLFGNILLINSIDLITIVSVGAAMVLLLALYYRQMLFSTFDPTGAYLSGLKPGRYDMLLYVMTAVTVILSIKLVGIILVSALLVTPSSIAKLFAHSFKQFTILAVVCAVIIVYVGLISSYYLDVPSGAMIILVGTGLFICSLLYQTLVSQVKKG